MKTGKWFMAVEAISTMAMAMVMVTLLLGLLFFMIAGCWLFVEFANTPIPTPMW